MVNVRVLFRPHTTLKQLLVKVKDPTPHMQRSNVVYRIPCRDCPQVYIGQTSRLLKTRINEHKAAVKHARTEESAVDEHVWVSKHQVDFQAATVLEEETNLHQRLALESWHIKKHSTFNWEAGTLSSAYFVSCSFHCHLRFGCSLTFFSFSLSPYLLCFYLIYCCLFIPFLFCHLPALVSLLSLIYILPGDSGISLIPFSLLHKMGLQLVLCTSPLMRTAVCS